MNVLLIVAEDVAVAQALRAALPEGDMLLFEPTLDAARRRLVSQQVDAVILDDAPHLGGAVIRPLKEMVPGAPVVALSSRGDLISQAALTRSGADAVVPKPFAFEVLREALQSVLTPRPVAPPQTYEQPQAPSVASALNQHQMALRWLGRAVHSLDPVRLSQSLVESAGDIFNAVRSAVLLDQDGAVRVIASQGISTSITETLRLDYASGLMRWFDEYACLIDRATVQQAPSAVKEMQLLNARLAAPLLRNGRVFGAIVLGEKASGANYSAEERDLLTLVARSTSTAFDRVHDLQNTSRKQDRLDRIVDGLPGAVVAVGPDRTVQLINAEAQRILKVKAADIIGRSIQKLGSSLADAAIRTLNDAQPRLQQQLHDPAVGGRLNVHVTPLGDEGVVLLFEKVLEEAVPAEEIAYSPFWEYLSERVAQEIKNPMVAINTFAQLLPRKYDSEDFRDAFSRVVQKEVSRINNVVETLFAFSRNPKLSLQRRNLNETLRDVLHSFEDALATRNIEVQTAWDPSVEDAEIDPIFFAQAVHNVVQNSIDAMPEGGTLSVATRKQQDTTEISISDTGPGVQAHDASLIFLPFYSTREKGMGLGLPLANRIMVQHHGDLQLAASEQHGTRFTLHLPALRKMAQERQHAEEGSFQRT